MAQVFTPVTDATFKLVKSKLNGLGASNYHRRFITDKTSFESLSRFLVESRNELGKTKNEDQLIDLKIQKLTSQPVIYKSNKTEESFQITFYFAEVNYVVLLAKYSHFKGFTKKIIVDHDYRFDGVQENVVLVSVSDILKHHYYQNKDDKEIGFSGLNPKTIKEFTALIKSSLTTDPVINRSQPVGFYSNIYDVENRKLKWTFEDFLGQLVDINQMSLDMPSVVVNLLSNYHYGHVIKEEVKRTIIELEEPMTLIEVFDKYEDTTYHDVREAIRLMKRAVTKKQQKELDNRYQDFVIKDNHLTPSGKSKFITHSSCSTRCDEFYKNKAAQFSLSYPIYAFQKLYVKRWIPGYSGRIICDIIMQKHEDESKRHTKHFNEKKGRVVDRHESRKHAKNFRIKRSKDWDHSFFSSSGGKSGRDKRWGAIMDRKDARMAKFDMEKDVKGYHSK